MKSRAKIKLKAKHQNTKVTFKAVKKIITTKQQQNLSKCHMAFVGLAFFFRCDDIRYPKSIIKITNYETVSHSHSLAQSLIHTRNGLKKNILQGKTDDIEKENNFSYLFFGKNTTVSLFEIDLPISISSTRTTRHVLGVLGSECHSRALANTVADILLALL